MEFTIFSFFFFFFLSILYIEALYTIISQYTTWVITSILSPMNSPWMWQNNEKHNNLQAMKLSDEDFMRKLESCIQFGYPLLLENVLEELDPALEPVLKKAIIKAGNSYQIKLGDNIIEYNPKFKFYITTKLRNPHYFPEVNLCPGFSMLWGYAWGHFRIWSVFCWSITNLCLKSLYSWPRPKRVEILKWGCKSWLKPMKKHFAKIVKQIFLWSSLKLNVCLKLSKFEIYSITLAQALHLARSMFKVPHRIRLHQYLRK